jgi:hypothetical protein
LHSITGVVHVERGYAGRYKSWERRIAAFHA